MKCRSFGPVKDSVVRWGSDALTFLIFILDSYEDRPVTHNVKIQNLGQRLLHIRFPGQMGEHDNGDRTVGFSPFLLYGLDADFVVAQYSGYL
jgi:hypothetical protein